MGHGCEEDRAWQKGFGGWTVKDLGTLRVRELNGLMAGRNRSEYTNSKRLTDGGLFVYWNQIFHETELVVGGIKRVRRRPSPTVPPPRYVTKNI